MVEGKSLGSRPKLNWWENLLSFYLSLFSCSPLVFNVFLPSITVDVTKLRTLLYLLLINMSTFHLIGFPSYRLFLVVYFIFYILAKAQLRFYNDFV